jgi:NAD+ synthase (glutamine-hydrolysing)
MKPLFHSLYSHGFVRGAVAIPPVRVAAVEDNVRHTLDLARLAHERRVALTVFPELGLTGYSCDDLFQQDALLERVKTALAELARETAALFPVLVVGAPLRLESGLFNCAVVLYQGRILGVVPKSYLPNYREFYEKRQFVPAAVSTVDEIELVGMRVPFGADLRFCDRSNPDFSFAVEICEDLWAPIAPSTFPALAGATLLLNLSASNATVGKAEYRRTIASSHSGKCIAGYLYSAAGEGESTTDLAWDGHGMMYENGRLLTETPRFEAGRALITADIDLERLIQERSRVSSFQDAKIVYRENIARVRAVPFVFATPIEAVELERDIERFPFVPADGARRDERCQEAYAIQVQGLAVRLRSARCQKVVIGVSGGLDSTQALLVAVKTMDRLGLPRTNVLAYTMPGFATSDRTLHNARQLMAALGVTPEEIDIRPSCEQMLRDLKHPVAQGKPVYDITYENVQAGERTSHLFRLANFHQGLVVGTGDLSELALGWCTYGVGDHMSHYNVNASVPKTLIQHLIRWVIRTGQCGAAATPVLQSILETGISPELIPAANPGSAGPADSARPASPAGPADSAGPAQQTELSIGPYELQDFHLYYISRFGFRPSKVAFLCHQAWKDPARGRWPEDLVDRHVYALPAIKKWLKVFVSRFFGSSQFKRTCVPNSPKVGSGGSLSPRGDWRAPSDGDAALWLDELERNVPD